MSWVFEAGAQILGAINDRETGDAKKDAAYDEARQMEQQAEQEVAVSSFNVQRLKKRVEQVMSGQQAAAASGGQSSTDATALAIPHETVQNAGMDELLMMAEAEESARMLKKDAKQTRRSGEIVKSDYNMRSFGKMLGAGATIVSAADDAGGWSNLFG